jgi:hypothetical protein
VHAAFYGSAWSGESIAVVVTSSAESINRSGDDGGAVAANERKRSSSSVKTALHLHFGSEASEVVAHIRGHEADLLAQLTRGAAVPAVGTSDDGSGIGDGFAATSAATPEASAREEDRPTSISTFSFLRSVALQMDAGGMGGGDEEDEDAAEKEAAVQKETNILQGAALTQWKKVHALRVL